MTIRSSDENKSQEPKKRRTRYVSKEERRKRKKVQGNAAYTAKARAALVTKRKTDAEIGEELIDNQTWRDDKVKRVKMVRKDNVNLVVQYNPLPHQYRLSLALDRGKRFVALIGGIQSGKTYAGAREALRQIYVHKRKFGIGWIVAPTYPMSLVAEREFESACTTPNGQLILRKMVGTREYLMRPNQEGEAPFLVQVKSADHPDRLRGAKVDWIWWDEAAFCSEEVFDILMGRVLASGGKIFITTTPQGKAHWLYQKFVKRAEEGLDDYAVVRAKTIDNRFLNRDMVINLYNDYDKEFALQELEGEFVDFSGLVYKDFSIADNTFDLQSIVPDLNKADQFVAGVDWGYSDPFVFLWIARIGDTWYLLDEYYKKGDITRNHIETIKRNPLTQHIVYAFTDVSRPEAMAEMSEAFRDQFVVLPGRTHRQDMIDGIEYVAGLIKNRKLKVANHCRCTIAEFGRYSWRDSKGANVSDRPRDAYNHAMDALRYALYSSRQIKPGKSIVPLNSKKKLISTIKQENFVKKIIRETEDYRAKQIAALNPNKSWMEV